MSDRYVCIELLFALSQFVDAWNFRSANRFKRKRSTQPCFFLPGLKTSAAAFLSLLIFKNLKNPTCIYLRFLSSAKVFLRSSITSHLNFFTMAFVPYRSNENGTLLAFAGPHVSPVGPLDSSSSSFQPDASAIALPNSSMFSDPLLAPVIKSTGGPNKRIWESHRALIKQLYLEEKKSLTEVMRLMRSEHSFKAT